MLIKNETLALILAAIFNLSLLIYAVLNLSISHDEARIFLSDAGFLHEFANLGFNLFPNFARIYPDLTLRAPFLALHFVNIFLLYKASKNILKFKSDRLISAGIFMFLPGVLASAILVNSAGFIILFALLCAYFVMNEKRAFLIAILCVSPLLGEAFLGLYLALLFYGIYKKSRFYLLLGVSFLILWIFCFDFDFGGKPKSHIIDTFGIFAAVFSPLVFIYFIYAVYRIWIKESKDFLWFLSASTFCLCVILSLRQRLGLELFLPYCVIFTPHMTRVFFASYRVRLPEFRLKYKILAVILLLSLAQISLSSIFFDFLYPLLKNPSKHFAYKYGVAKELANELKNRNIKAVKSDGQMKIRLEFYGITSGKEFYLDTKTCGENLQKDEIKISKFGKVIAEFKLCRNR